MKKIEFNVNTKSFTEVEISDKEKNEIKKQENINEKNSKINELKNQISSTDYKIIKCYEYNLVGLELPYDIQELHESRQAMRDEINELETQISQV